MRTGPSGRECACGSAACVFAHSTGSGAGSSRPLCSHCTAPTLAVGRCPGMTVAGAPSIPFLELLACPFCAGTLEEERDRLVCTVCARTFPVSDGAPVLLPGPTPAERARGLVGRAVAAVVAVPAGF